MRRLANDFEYYFLRARNAIGLFYGCAKGAIALICRASPVQLFVNQVADGINHDGRVLEHVYGARQFRRGAFAVLVGRCGGDDVSVCDNDAAQDGHAKPKPLVRIDSRAEEQVFPFAGRVVDKEVDVNRERCVLRVGRHPIVDYEVAKGVYSRGLELGEILEAVWPVGSVVRVLVSLCEVIVRGAVIGIEGLEQIYCEARFDKNRVASKAVPLTVGHSDSVFGDVEDPIPLVIRAADGIV